MSEQEETAERKARMIKAKRNLCLLYTSDAADERSSADLGGRRIITKKKKTINENKKTKTSSETKST